MSESIVAMVIIAGIGVVLPLALGHARRWWVAAGAVFLSTPFPVGPLAAAIATVWLVIALGVLIESVRRVWSGARALPITAVVPVAAAGFAVVAASVFVASRAGWSLFGIGEPIVELTAVHFTYAGVGALTLAGAVLSRATGARRVVARVGVLLCLAAPPVVATGFVTGRAAPQVGGALLMTSGVLVTAALQFHDAIPVPWSTARVLLLVSSALPWLPMILAVGWAASNFWSVPALSVPDMVRTHGTLNTVFVVTGLLARREMQTMATTHRLPTSCRPAVRTEAA